MKNEEEDSEIQTIRHFFADILKKKKDHGAEEAVNGAMEKLAATTDRGCNMAWELLHKKADLAAAIEHDLHRKKESLLRKREVKERKLTQAKQENQRVKEDLCRAKLELSEVREQYERGRDQAKMQEKEYKAQSKKTNREHRQQYTESILLRTAVEKLEKELEQLKNEHMLQIIDLKKRNTRKDMLLERKLSEVTNALEKSVMNDPPVGTTPEDAEERNHPE